MPGNESHETGRLIREFLNNPKSRFFPFFQHCSRLAYARLASLRASGWRLPADNHELANLAAETIEPVFLHPDCRLQQNIIDYFVSEGVTDFRSLPVEELERKFLPFFYQKCKEGLSKSQRQLYPERYRVRKNYDHVLSPPEYPPVALVADGITHLSLAEKLRVDAAPVGIETMSALAMESFQRTTTDTALCRDFFARLHSRDDLQNFTRKRQLVSCLVHLRESLSREVLGDRSSIPTPEVDLLRTRVELARRWTGDQLRSWIETNWGGSETISAEVAAVMLHGCCLYLEDYTDGCGTDPKASYFREVAPAELQADYNRLYKYNFLKLIGLAEGLFERRLAFGPRQNDQFGANT